MIHDEHYGQQAQLIVTAARGEEDRLLGIKDSVLGTLEGVQAFATIRYAQKRNALWWTLIDQSSKDVWWEVERWYRRWDRDSEP